MPAVHVRVVAAFEPSARLLVELARQDREPLSVTVKRDGQVYIQNTPVAEDDLVAKLAAIAANGYEQRIFVRGDRSVDYGRVMSVMGLLSAAGFTHIGLVTDVEKPKPEKE